MKSTLRRNAGGLAALVTALMLPHTPLLEHHHRVPDTVARVYIPLVSTSIRQRGESGDAYGLLAADSVRRELARRLGVAPADITVVEALFVEWPDSCLGATAATGWAPMTTQATVCATAITPGYCIVLEVNGSQYVYHTDLNGSCYILVAAPAAG